MMNKEDRDILQGVCCDVFEQLAFMFSDELEDDEIETDAGTFIRASMGFKGTKQGTVSIVVPKEISTTLAYNILGLDEDEAIDDDGAVDALKELLNTITGRLMTSIFGENVVIDLTVPETDELDRRSWEALAEGNEYIAIDIEEHPVLITMQS